MAGSSMQPCGCSAIHIGASKKRSSAKEIPQDTSVLQQWYVPPKHDGMPRPVKDINFPKPEFRKSLKRKGHTTEEIGMNVSVNKDAVEELLETVSQHCANSGLLHFSVKPTTQSERAADTVPMDRQVQELIIYKQGSPVTSECEALRDIDLKSAYFQELVTQYVSAQSIPTTLAAHIESITREQSKSSLWHQLHNGRITSSIFGDIIHRRKSTAPDNLIN